MRASAEAGPQQRAAHRVDERAVVALLPPGRARALDDGPGAPGALEHVLDHACLEGVVLARDDVCAPQSRLRQAMRLRQTPSVDGVCLGQPLLAIDKNVSLSTTGGTSRRHNRVRPCRWTVPIMATYLLGRASLPGLGLAPRSGTSHSGQA